MTSLAPSQTLFTPDDPRQQPALPAMSDMLRNIDRTRPVDDTAMKSAIMPATKVNPDDAARAIALGRQEGVGGEIAVQNKDELKMRAILRDIDRRQLPTNDPVLADFLSRPDAAMVAYDQLDNLEQSRDLFNVRENVYKFVELEQQAQATAGQVARTAVALKNFDRNVLEYAGEAATEAGRAIATAQDIAANTTPGTAFRSGREQSRAMKQAGRYRVRGNITKDEIAEIDSYMERADAMYEETGGGFVTGSSRIAGQMYEPFKEATYRGSQTGLVFAGAAVAASPITGGLSLAAAKPAAMLGFGAGFTASLAESMYAEMAGYSYYNMRKEGVDEGTAQVMSTIAGAVNASLEFVGFAPLVGQATKTVGRIVTGKIVQEVTRRSVARAAGTAGLQVSANVGAEVVTEVAQEVTDAVALTIGQEWDGKERGMLLTEEGREELYDNIAQTVVDTAEGMLLLSLPGPALGFGVNARAIRRSKKLNDRLGQIYLNVEQGQLAKRDPEAARQLYQKRSEGTAFANLYIEARQVDVLLRNAEIDPRSLDGILPGFSTRLSQALETNGDIHMTSAEFLPQLAMTDVGQAMKPHIRVADPDNLSPAEMVRAQEEARAAIQRMRDASESRTEAEAAFAESAGRVEDQIAAMIAATGKFSPEQSRTLTDLHVHFVISNAPRVFRKDADGNMVALTPEEFFEAFKYSILGPDVMGAQPAATGRQRSEIAPGVAAPQRPAGMTDAAYERLILDEFEAPTLPETDAGQLQAQNDVAQSAIENSSISDKAKRGLVVSVNDVTSALKRRNVVDLANALWKLRQRLSALETVPAELQALATSIEQRLASLGIAIEAPQVGADHRGELELGIITSFPNKDSKQVFDRIKNVQAPVVRRNGVVISRAQVTVEEGAAAFEDQRRDAFDAEEKRLTDEVQDRMARVRQAVSDSRTEARPAAGLAQQQVAQMDADYMAAVERGDEAAAQRMVDEAALQAGYTQRAYKAMPSTDSEGQPITEIERPTEFPAFNRGERGIRIAGFFAEDRGFAERFAQAITKPPAPIYEVYLREQNPYVIEAAGRMAGDVQFGESGREFREAVRSGKYDSVIIRNTTDEGTIHVALTPNQIKSADAVVRDESGAVVPLSSRFNLTSRKVYEQAPVPAPDAGVFDANNPPAPLADGQPIVAVLTSDGEVLYDRAATMHGDLAEKFPDKADLIIDGGFIVDGQYQMGQSRGGWSALEGEPDQVALAKELAAKANERRPTVLEQRPTATPAPQRGPIEAAKALVRDAEQDAISDADEFFKKRWASLLQRTKRTVKPVPSNFREAARRAVADILDFVKANPKFADYYEKDWKLTRQILDDFVGRPITDDEFAMFRAIAGLTSPNTMLPANISDTVGIWNHWMQNGNFDAFTLGPKPLTGALVLFTSPVPISGTTANVKVRTIQIVEQLIKEQGSVTAALAFLQEGVTVSELHKFNRKMGYSGNVGDIGNIQSLVKQATGQDKLIPRMFVFGQKVGAYTLNAIGDSRYTTVDIWESRYIRSHFTGMFEENIGLPETTDEHQIFTRFGYVFKEEMERVTGRTWAPSALQALRWFYIIETARKAGYNKASTNETISFYTERRLAQAFGYQGLGGGGGQQGTGAVAAGAGGGQVQAAVIPPKPFKRDLSKDVDKIADQAERRRAVAASTVGYARHNSERNRVDFRFDERRLGTPRQHGVLTGAQVIADFVPGTLLADNYSEVGLPAPTIQELSPDAASAQAFRDLVLATNESNPHGAAVYAYSAEEYATKRLFVTADGKGGFALTPDGDIVSVFSAPKSGNGRSLMALAVEQGGIRLDCFDTALPGYYAPHGFVAVARLPWNDAFAPEGWDYSAFAEYNNGRPDVVFMVYQRYSNRAYRKPIAKTETTKAVDGDGVKVTSYEAGVQEQAKRLAEQKRLLEQAAPEGEPQGSFDVDSFEMRVNKSGNVSTLIHEGGHYWLEVMGRMALDPNATAEVMSDFDAIMRWFGIEGATPAERAAKWNSMSLDEKRPHHEAFARNMEIWTYEGKAPSAELQPAFERFARWLKRIYVNIRDVLNAQYREQFGVDMPIMSPEVRGVFERMFASQEQIERARAIRSAMAQFETQEQSGMDDATWAEYQRMVAEEASEAEGELRKATMAEMKWLDRARAGRLREMQKDTDKRREEVRAEVQTDLSQQRVYRAREFLKRGIYVDETGEQQVSDVHKLDLEAVKRMYELEPDELKPNLAKMGYGKLGMLAKEGGMDPDVAAEMLGYESADQMVRELLEAPSLEEAVEAETNRRMVIENGELNTPEQRQEAVDRALHTEVRSRLVAVELRWMAKATQPVRLMVAAAKALARSIIGGKRIRDIRPREYVSAEARAAKDARAAFRDFPDPEVAGRSAYTRSMNEQASAIAAGMPVSDAEAIARQAQADAVARSQARIDEFKAKYPAQDPAGVAIAAKRQEMLNNQLAREALAAREEVDKALVRFRRLFKADKDIAKTRDMNLVAAARAILAAHGLGRSEATPESYIKAIRDYNPELYAEIEPVINAASRDAQDYRSMTMDEFRNMRDAVEALWFNARRNNQMMVEGKMIAVEQAVAELNARMEEMGVPDVGLGERNAVTRRQKTFVGLGSVMAIMGRVEHWAAGMDGRSTNAFTKYIYRVINDAAMAYQAARLEFTGKYAELVQKLTLPKGRYHSEFLNYTFGMQEGGSAVAEILGAMQHMGNRSNLEKLLLGRGWAEVDENGNLDTSRWDAFLEDVYAKGLVTKEHMDFLQATWDLCESMKPLAQRAHYDVYGFYFKEIEPTPIMTPFGEYRGGYVPAARDRFMVPRSRQLDAMEDLTKDFRNAMPSVNRGFTYERTGDMQPLTMDVMLMTKHIDDVVKFAYMQPAVKDVLKIINNREFQRRLDRLQPSARTDLLTPWLVRSATQSNVTAGLHPIGDKFWNWVRSRRGASIMFANVRNAMQQFTGWGPSLEIVDARHLGGAFLTYVQSPRQTANRVADASGFMNLRMRGQMLETYEQIAGIVLKPNLYQKAQKWSQKHGYFLQTMTQNIVDIVTWTGAYNQSLERSGKDATDSEAHKQAVADADSAVRRSQGSLNPQDVSRLETGTPFYRTFMQFTSYFNNLANLNASEYNRTVKGMGFRGTPRLLYIYMMGWAVPMVMSEAIVRGLGGSLGALLSDDDEERMDAWMKLTVYSQLRAAGAIFPPVGVGAQLVVGGFTAVRYDDRMTQNPSMAALERGVGGTSKAIYDVMLDDKEFSGQHLRDGLTLLSLLTGFPLEVVSRPGSYLIEVERGNIEPTDDLDYIRGLITGAASPESKR